MTLRSPTRMLLLGVAMAAGVIGVYRQGPEVEPSAAPQPSSGGIFAVAPESPGPHIIGPTAQVTEATTGVPLLARVDTGAKTTSLHCTEGDLVIDGESSDPTENVGKPARIRVENQSGVTSWVETELIDYIEVRSANGAEHRYLVRLPLTVGPVTKETLVNLNDRSSMTYRLLLGRDFLAGDFVVDVAQPGVAAL